MIPPISINLFTAITIYLTDFKDGITNFLNLFTVITIYYTGFKDGVTDCLNLFTVITIYYTGFKNGTTNIYKFIHCDNNILYRFQR